MFSSCSGLGFDIQNFGKAFRWDSAFLSSKPKFALSAFPLILGPDVSLKKSYSSKIFGNVIIFCPKMSNENEIILTSSSSSTTSSNSTTSATVDTSNRKTMVEHSNGATNYLVRTSSGRFNLNQYFDLNLLFLKQSKNAH